MVGTEPSRRRALPPPQPDPPLLAPLPRSARVHLAEAAPRGRGVRPGVIYEHQSYAAAAAALDPGARRGWQIPLAPPAAPGTFAATVRIHYVVALGRGSVPVVIQVPAPDGSPGPVRLGLAADP